MKKLSLFIFLFFLQYSMSQEFYFDTILEYKELKSLASYSYSINSKDGTYYLYTNHGIRSDFPTIIDSNQNVKHEFEALNRDDSTHFKYLQSKELIVDPYGSNFVVEQFEKKVDSTRSDIKIVVFKNKRKKKIECEIDILIDNSDSIFCNQLLYTFCHGRLNNTNFSIRKGNLLRFKIVFENSFKIEMNLINKEKTNLILTAKNNIKK